MFEELKAAIDRVMHPAHIAAREAIFREVTDGQVPTAAIPATQPATHEGETPVNAFETVILDAEKGIEVGVGDALKLFGAAESKAPAALTGLTAVAGAVEKALQDVAADAANPTQLILTLPSQVTDLKAVWPAVKTFLATLGVK